MSSKATSLKAKIKNYAKSNNIAAQVVLQNYIFERFLARMSQSEYSEKFVIKGGMLTKVENISIDQVASVTIRSPRISLCHLSPSTPMCTPYLC